MSSTRKCRKKSVLVDCKVVVVPYPSDLKVMEPYTVHHEAEAKERYAAKLSAFFENHLEQGVCRVYVERDYEVRCSNCDDAWSEDFDKNGVAHCAHCGAEMEVVR